jgi:hypothetical protein
MPRKKIGDFLDHVARNSDPFVTDAEQAMESFGLEEDQKEIVRTRNLLDLANAVWDETPGNPKHVNVKLRPVRH